MMEETALTSNQHKKYNYRTIHRWNINIDFLEHQLVNKQVAFSQAMPTNQRDYWSIEAKH
jgi:hypothetical protein